MTSLPLFGHTKAVLGYSIFDGANDLQIKKIIGFPETRLEDLSNELSWAQFGCQEGLQRDLKVALCIEPVALRVG